MSGHTPGPWAPYASPPRISTLRGRHGPKRFALGVSGPDPENPPAKAYGRTPSEAEANARLIARAVNAHDALLSALEKAVQVIARASTPNPLLAADMEDALNAARAAIALAKEEGP